MEQQKTTNHNESLVNEEEVEQLLQQLPKIPIGKNLRLVQYQGHWCPDHSDIFKSIIAFQKHFKARDTDLIIASFPKTGTTWLKSLLYTIINREKYTLKDTPLLKNHPHELVYRLEVDVYGNAFEFPRPHHLNQLPEPRLLHTHLPYISLPDSIKESRCKVIYISRNPMDTLVSLWYFFSIAVKKIEGKSEDSEVFTMEELFEDFIQGKVIHGPFFEHVIEYWKLSMECPEKVLFLKYEDLKDQPEVELKKLSEFVGVPFSMEEENGGIVKDIVELCSIGSMKEMEGNKSGVFNKFFEKKSYFRKGEVGEWKQYLSPSMVSRMKEAMKEKFEKNGLSF